MHAQDSSNIKHSDCEVIEAQASNSAGNISGHEAYKLNKRNVVLSLIFAFLLLRFLAYLNKQYFPEGLLIASVMYDSLLFLFRDHANDVYIGHCIVGLMFYPLYLSLKKPRSLLLIFVLFLGALTTFNMLNTFVKR